MSRRQVCIGPSVPYLLSTRRGQTVAVEDGVVVKLVVVQLCRAHGEFYRDPHPPKIPRFAQGPGDVSLPNGPDSLRRRCGERERSINPVSGQPTETRRAPSLSIMTRPSPHVRYQVVLTGLVVLDRSRRFFSTRNK